MARPMLICGVVLACVFISVEAQGNNHSNQCYHCGADDDARQGAVTNPRMCRAIKSCADDEVCHVSTISNDGIVSYETGCMQLLSCQVLTIGFLQADYNIDTGIDLPRLYQTGVAAPKLLGRKSQIRLCDVCCGDSLCNNEECESLRNRIFHLAIAGKFNYTTLSLIR